MHALNRCLLFDNDNVFILNFMFHPVFTFCIFKTISERKPRGKNRFYKIHSATPQNCAVGGSGNTRNLRMYVLSQCAAQE